MKSKNSVKLKFGIIAALALALLISLASLLGINLASADRSVTINGSSIFVTTSNAEVWAHREQDGEATLDYTMFAFSKDEDTVNFRKNLAYKWYENTAAQPEADEDGEETAKTVEFQKGEGWFNMEIGFADSNNKDGKLQFEKYVISFESQQYAQDKDGKTTNYIVFTPAEEAGKVDVYVIYKEPADKDLNAVLDRLSDTDKLGTVDDDHITIEFTGYENGEYTVVFNNDTNLTGKFENVGKTYSKYSSSTTTPVTPLSFKAIFAEEDGDQPAAHGNAFMTLYSLNGQSFKLTGTRDSGGHLTGGTVNDTTPPVLCLNKEVKFIQYNGEISFDYTVIDVLTSSPSLNTPRGTGVYYYMLKKDKAAPAYDTDGGDYKAVTDADDKYIFPHSGHYLPTDSDYKKAKFDGEYLTVKAAVKVVMKLTDTTASGAQTTYVPLDWYVDGDFLVGVDGTDYIAVATDKLGAAFSYSSYDETTSKWVSDPENSSAWSAAVESYKAAVSEAAKDLKAGSKNYFYLPSVESLLTDNSTSYQDLKFSIYYNNGTQQQSSNKSSNELSINLTKAGKYIFTVYATDAAGNPMFYFDGDGKPVEFEAGDIWNMYDEEEDSEFAGMKKYLPWFEFTVDYSEISIEEPDEQSTAYVDSSYTPDSFEINGVSVKTVYSLYEFENGLWAEDHDGVALTYDEFIAQKDTLIVTGRKYFTKIRTTSELEEGTADYDKFNPYGWNGTSLSFTPQTANAFYLIKCEASSYETATPVTKCMAIAAAPKVEALKGEDTWAQDNMTSIILLCIAGASLIGIILLLVIKPKNKGDLDEVVVTPKKKK
jgi:hypothetical protein